MPRVKRGTKRRAKRKKILDRASGYFLTKSKLYRAAKESVERGLKFAYAGRRQKKRNFRALWIQRINAGTRELGLTYGRFINGLDKAGKKVEIEIPGSCRDADGTDCTVFPVPRDRCTVFEAAVHNTGTVVNDVRLVEGHLLHLDRRAGA